MAWLNNAVPNVWQWIGLFATFVGTAMAIWAALSAKGAKQQARKAKAAALRLGNSLQLSDLLHEVQELQLLLVNDHFREIADASARLAGRIVRMKTLAYNSLGDEISEQFCYEPNSAKPIAEVFLMSGDERR